jgi:hypothetical protein
MNRDQWIAAENIRAVADAESYLVDFVPTFAELPWPMKPAAIRYAVGHLTVLALSDEVRAEIFLRDVAVAADVSKPVLRKQVADRCWFFRNLNRLVDDRKTCDEAKAELVRIITQ